MDNRESVRQLLESRLKEPTKKHASRESIQIQQVADPVDMTMQAEERELATQSMNRRAGLVRQLRTAIDRVKDVAYGICRECEGAIATKRLKAIPWAELCIGCQEAADRSVRTHRDDIVHYDYREAA